MCIKCVCIMNESAIHLCSTGHSISSAEKNINGAFNFSMENLRKLHYDPGPYIHDLYPALTHITHTVRYEFSNKMLSKPRGKVFFPYELI